MKHPRIWLLGSLLQSISSLVNDVSTQTVLTSALLEKEARHSYVTRSVHTLTGEFRYHEYFKSHFLAYRRTLIVYLPPSYRKNSQKHYPVLYMHDGNNVFDSATAFLGMEWEADETAQRLINLGKIQEVIIVGIYNTPARIQEYTWMPMQFNGIRQGGDGPKYAKFLTQEVKPFIDYTYRTLPDRDNTAVLGSSLGGLISFYIGRHFSDVFGKIGVMSPSFWWNHGAAFKEVRDYPKTLKIWLDIGTEEGSVNLKNAREMHRMLKNHGFREGINLKYFEDRGGKHSELTWARRFDKPLLFLFSKDAEPNINPLTSLSA